jgi:hypothetical protein
VGSKRVGRTLAVLVVCVTFCAAAPVPVSAQRASAKTGTITGRVTLTGKAPANPVIRMGADPLCAALARRTGALPLQQLVIADSSGGVANTFVSLQGTFADTPVPRDPITIAQRTCIYEPRVVAGRVGQTLRIVNQDETLHNLHSLSTGNAFNVTQPKWGMVFSYTLKNPDVMLRLTCDVHSWMRGYVAVVAHPYFAVSGRDGTFTIANVPPGRYSIKTWHERFGEQTRTVTVASGRAATLDVRYDPAAKRGAVAVQDVNVTATE